MITFCGHRIAVTARAVYCKTLRADLDLTPLRRLSSLTALDLQAISLKNPAILGQLASLRSLRLGLLHWPAKRALNSGSVRSLTLATSLRSVPFQSLGSFPKLETVWIEHYAGGDLSPFKRFSSIRSLRIEGFGTTVHGVEQLIQLRSLSVKLGLNAEGRILVNDSLSRLNALTRLESLELRIRAERTISGWWKLRRLKNLEVETAGPLDVAKIEELSSLERLRLQLSCRDEQRTVSLNRLTRLQRLELDACASIAINLGKLTGLTHITINSSRSIGGLASLANPAGLVRLHVSPANAKDIETLERMVNLRALSLRIGEPTISLDKLRLPKLADVRLDLAREVPLGFLAHSPALKRLRFVLRDGRVLATLPVLPSVEDLFLTTMRKRSPKNDVDGALIAIKFPGLLRLELAVNALDNCEELAKLRRLQRLSLTLLNLRALRCVGQYTQLQAVSLRSNGAPFEKPLDLSRMKSLRHLALSGKGIPKLGLSALPRGIRRLELESSDVKAFGWVSTLLHLRRITIAWSSKSPTSAPPKIPGFLCASSPESQASFQAHRWELLAWNRSPFFRCVSNQIP